MQHTISPLISADAIHVLPIDARSIRLALLDGCTWMSRVDCARLLGEDNYPKPPLRHLIYTARVLLSPAGDKTRNMRFLHPELVEQWAQSSRRTVSKRLLEWIAQWRQQPDLLEWKHKPAPLPRRNEWITDASGETLTFVRNMGSDYTTPPCRDGALDYQNIPSLINGKSVYRDGRRS